MIQKGYIRISALCCFSLSRLTLIPSDAVRLFQCLAPAVCTPFNTSYPVSAWSGYRNVSVLFRNDCVVVKGSSTATQHQHTKHVRLAPSMLTWFGTVIADTNDEEEEGRHSVEGKFFLQSCFVLFFPVVFLSPSHVPILGLRFLSLGYWHRATTTRPKKETRCI